MKRTMSGLACAAGLVIGLALTGSAEAAGPAGVMTEARASLVPAVSAETAELVEEVNYRRRHYRGRHWDRRRHRGSNFSFQLHIGPPAYYRPPPRVYYPQQRYVYALPAAHVRWCYNRYRSYRKWDNTFQPYHGPRRPCISPYY